MGTENGESFNDSYNMTIDEINYDVFVENIPGFLFFIIVSVVGTFGNANIILLYWRKFDQSNYRTAIIFLAVVDLSICSIVVPLRMVEIRYKYASSESICKCAMYLVHLLGQTSLYILAFIAVERYRKVCHATKAQFTQLQVRIICLVIFLIMVVISIPALFLFKSESIEIFDYPGYNGTVCHADGRKKIFARTFSGITILIGVFSIGTCLFCYSNIGRVIYTKVKSKQFSLRFSRHIETTDQSSNATMETEVTKETGPESVNINNATNTDLKENTLSKNKVPVIGNSTDLKENTESKNEFRVIGISTDLKENKKTKNQPPVMRKKKRPISSMYDRTLQIAFMFLVTTVLSFLFCLVSIIVDIIETKPDLERSMLETLGGSFYIFSGFLYLSNAINPIVYGFIDNKLRKEFIKLYTSIFCFICRRH